MTQVIKTNFSVKNAHDNGVEKLRHMEKFMLAMPQAEVKTEHVLHGGVYARTLIVRQGTLVTGVLVKVPTVLIVYGNCRISNGLESVDVQGYNVIPAAAPRKVAMLAFEETKVTMIFATDVATVEEAEEMFTDEAELLITRKSSKGREDILIGEIA